MPDQLSALYKAGHHEKILEFLNNEISKDPFCSKNYTNRSVCLEALGCLTEALDDAELAFRIAQESHNLKPRHYFRLADLQIKDKQLDQARTTINEFIIFFGRFRLQKDIFKGNMGLKIAELEKRLKKEQSQHHLLLTSPSDFLIRDRLRGTSPVSNSTSDFRRHSVEEISICSSITGPSSKASSRARSRRNMRINKAFNTLPNILYEKSKTKTLFPVYKKPEPFIPPKPNKPIEGKDVRHPSAEVSTDAARREKVALDQLISYLDFLDVPPAPPDEEAIRRYSQSHNLHIHYRDPQHSESASESNTSNRDEYSKSSRSSIIAAEVQRGTTSTLPDSYEPSRNTSIHTSTSRRSSVSHGIPSMVGMSPVPGGPRVNVSSTPSKSEDTESEDDDSFDDEAVVTGGKRDTFDTAFTPLKPRKKDSSAGLLQKLSNHKTPTGRRSVESSLSPSLDWIGQSFRRLSNGNSTNKSRFILNLDELEGFNKYDEDFIEACANV